MAKNIVVPIVSDASKFLAGFDEAIKKLEQAANKTDIGDGLQKQFLKLNSTIKESQEQIDKMLKELHSGSVQTSVFKDFEDQTLSTFKQIESAITDLQSSTKRIFTQIDTGHLDKFINNTTKRLEEISDQSKNVQSVFSNMFAKADTGSVNATEGLAGEFDRLQKEITEVSIAFDSFDKNLQKDKTGKVTKEYQEIANKLALLVNQLLFLDEAMDGVLSGDDFDYYADLSESAISLGQITAKQCSVIDNSAREWVNSISKASTEIKEEVQGTISSFTVKEGKIKVPIALEDNALKKIKANIDSIKAELEKFYNTNPIKVGIKTQRDQSSEITVVDTVTQDISKMSVTLQKLLDQKRSPIDPKNLTSINDTLKKVLSSVDSLRNGLTQTATAGQEVVNVDFTKLEDQVNKTCDRIITTITSSVTQIDNLISRGLNISSTSELENSWSGIQSLFSSIISQTEKLDLRSKKTKEQITELFDVYKKYKELGGLNNIESLSDGSANSKKLLSHYSKYSTKATEASSVQSSKSLDGEADKFNEVAESAHKAADGKNEFVNANLKTDESATDSVSSLDKEGNELKELASDATSAAQAMDSLNKQTKENIGVNEEYKDSLQNDGQTDDDISDQEKKIKTIQKKLDNGSYEKINNNLQKQFIALTRSEEAAESSMKDVQTAYKNLQNAVKLGGSHLIEAEEKYQSALKNTNRLYDQMRIDKQVDLNPLYKQTWITRVQDYMSKNTAATKDFGDELQRILSLMNTTDNKLDFENAIKDFVKIKGEIASAGKAGASILDMWSNRMKSLAVHLGSFVSFYDFINILRQGYQYIADIDAKMIELEKVSTATGTRLEESLEKSSKTAKEIGATISDTISATADWSRLGYGIDQSEELAKVATIYKNVGDGIDIDTANESLISTLQGFQLEAENAMHVIDVFNEVANTQAISSAGIGESLKRSAASFDAANTSLEKSVALVTATNEVLQDPESVGTLWKTMSARIRGATTELIDLGEETDQYTETTSKLGDLVMSLTGFDIMIDENTFKDVYDIILGIGQEWDKLTDIEQASLGEALAGMKIYQYVQKCA